MRDVSALDPAHVALVDDRLEAVRREHGVHIALAVESGSRAWGFPSPDSDLDCRFLYIRPVRDYLDPWPPRDVIETPLDDLLDVNGWDLIKALRLLVKGNATVLEWLRSPIVYAGSPEFWFGLTALAEEVTDRPAMLRHYLHLGVGQRERWATGDALSIKKVFYVLRPAAVLAWLRTHPGRVLAPLDLTQLLTESGADGDIRTAVADLIARKAATREGGRGQAPPVVWRFIDEELLHAASGAPADPHDPARLTAARARARDYFIKTIQEHTPSKM